MKTHEGVGKREMSKKTQRVLQTETAVMSRMLQLFLRLVGFVLRKKRKLKRIRQRTTKSLVYEPDLRDRSVSSCSSKDGRKEGKRTNF